MSRVKIVAHNSEGHRIKAEDVRVEVDGKPLDTVSSVKWEVSVGGYATCHIVMHDVELDFDFDMKVRETPKSTDESIQA